MSRRLTDAVAAMHEAEKAGDAAVLAVFDQCRVVRREQSRLDELEDAENDARRAFECARDAVVAAAADGQ